jgi:filamentous hemagglutinin family protein
MTSISKRATISSSANKKQPASLRHVSVLRRAPIAKAIAVLFATGVMGMGQAEAQQVFSRAWYGKQQQQMQQMRATGVLPNGQPITNPQQQQQQSREQLQRSWGNVNRAAQALAASLNAQQIARTNGGNVPVVTVTDGVGGNGLVVDLGKAWQNATLKNPVTENGQTKVTIEQDAARAIAYWDSFNVGKNTHVHFDQQGNSDWAILNKVSNSVAPSQIQGKVTADGTVLIVNNNGVVFTGTSQVNVRNLVAAAANISDSQFMDKGIYVDTAGTQPTFKDALGNIVVDAGAQITTHIPTSATQGGGYVLLMGQEVRNAGEINTANGQTTLAAGDSFSIRKGVGTDGNTKSTTRGNEVAASLNANSTTTGKVINTGVIKASTGDITLTGHDVEQSGVAIATTSTSTRGTIHLLNSTSDTTGKVTLGKDSVTAIMLDEKSATALDSQKDAGIKNVDGLTNPQATGNFDNLSTLSDRGDLSRIEIVSGNTVDFQGDSLTLATGGQVAVTAKERTLVREGADIDVSGAIGVAMSMESNSIKINIQGNEQRDASVNRESGNLNNNDVWVDVRDLIFVPAGTNGYATDRWYTAGGLLEVAGYLATSGHTVGEWMAQGGTVQFGGKEVVTQAGSRINLSGGTLDVATGYVNQSWLKGADGRLYEVSSAPGDLLYTGVYKGFEVTSERWGVTKTYYNPLLAKDKRIENGYTVGRDAGKLVVSTTSAVLEGDLVSDTFQGSRQVTKPQSGLDGYYQSHTAVARGAQLIVGNYTPVYNKDSGTLDYSLNPVANQVILKDTQDKITAGLDLNTALPSDRINNIVLDTTQLNSVNLGGLKVSAKDSVTVEDNLTLGNGGDVTLYAPKVDVNADIVAHGGSIQLGNVLTQYSGNQRVETTVLAGAGTVTLVDGAKLDVSGVWSNSLLGSAQDTVNNNALAYVNGGKVAIVGTGNITLGQGSLVDVSSGAAINTTGKTIGGKGGDVTLHVYASSSNNPDVSLGGDIRAQGVTGGGKLAIQAGKVFISDDAVAPVAGTLVLDGDFFNKGFSDYQIVGTRGLTVADNTVVDVTMPVYRLVAGAQYLGTDAGKSDALEVWTPPVYLDDMAKQTLTQRKGASLSLQAGLANSNAADMATTSAVVGTGAVINVDPGQKIAISSIGQLTVDGTLNAWGGDIRLTSIDMGTLPAIEDVNAAGHNRSIWVGDHAVLDVAARAVTAASTNGAHYGQVKNGGSIVIGGTIDHAKGSATGPDLFVVVREGAVLDASGAQATLTIGGRDTTIATNGGTISLASNNGIYLDGTLLAKAGGANAAGGTLSVAMDAPMYRRPVQANVLNARELVLEQTRSADALHGSDDPATAALTYGHGRLSVDQVHAGGFDSLSLMSGNISFAGDTTLNMRQNLQLYGGLVMADNAPADANINLSGSYVRLASKLAPSRDGTYQSVNTVVADARVESQSYKIDANLIDIRGGVALKSQDVVMTSQGDLRFLGLSDGWNGDAATTVLSSNGNMVLRAAQLYPDTGVGAEVKVGYGRHNGVLGYDPARTLTIGRTTEAVPALPYSAFGYLGLMSGNIEQGGIVRAPLGHIQLGESAAGGVASLHVNLLDKSITSVSGAGLVMPYGGTIDGQSWQYDGKAVTFTGAGGANSRGKLVTGVTLAGIAVDVQDGALLDLSGGGELAGAGFVSGRGGSTDARFNPLVQNSLNGGFTLPGLSTNPVYAIVPGVQNTYAPIGGEHGAVDPAIGRQITIGAGVPGLPPGTYTLMPSTYALMPGAFRVEINGLAGQGGTSAAQAMRNGSWSLSGTLSVAGTTIRDSLSSQLIVTPASVLRTYSQYNETTYADFAIADAARRGIPRPALPMDAKTLKLDLANGAGEQAFTFNGQGNFKATEGGYGGTLSVVMTQGQHRIEVINAGEEATAGFTGITLYADSLNNIGAARMVIGATPTVVYDQGGNYINFTLAAEEVHLRSGVQLYAPEVFLIAADGLSPWSGMGGLINVEKGAGINTLGRGKVAYDAYDGFIYASAGYMLAASNGLLNVVPSTAVAKGGIEIGGCSVTVCTGDTTLYSEGTLLMSTNGRFMLDDAVRYGTRNLTLAVGAINVGSEAALADAQAQGISTSGLAMNQTMLDRLLRGDTTTGAPAIETLVLSAASSVNFYGDVVLDTYDAQTGKSTLDRLVLTTPAIYGYGDANTEATIRTANLVWGGAQSSAGSIVANGAGTGSGTLNLQTERLEFGFGPFTQPGNITAYDRMALGFANVNMQASERMTANNKGNLSVYQSRGTYVEGQGFEYTGGNLTITTPLMTGEAGSSNHIVVGGTIDIKAPAATTTTDIRTNDALGAELSLHGKNVTVATKVVLPSGKLTLIADDNLHLTDDAYIDMAGRKINFNDVDKYSWGGNVVLESIAGNIHQASGAIIDLSAVNNKAGSLKATALDATAGMVDLQGTILGNSSGYYDAGGTMVPYKAGFVEVHAQTLGSTGTLDSQFAALNDRLNQGGMAGGRSFQLKQGDLTIGNELKAGEVNVSVDNGSLMVAGTIDASGERVGTIRLSGKNGLTIGSNAVLDAHGTVLRVDSYGKIIDSPNRAIVELNSGHGTLTLADGAKVDLRHGTSATVGAGKGQNDGVARGTLTLNAPRIGSNGAYDDADAATYGDIAIDTRGNIGVLGAKAITVNGMYSYNDADYATVKDANGNEVIGLDGKPVRDVSASGREYQVINQKYLKDKHGDSVDFMDAALGNNQLLDNKLAGLNNATYADAFHLRPGVEIVSATPDGDLVVQGDLDLSAYRYESLNAKTKLTGGEAGALTLRAGGNLDVFGSINDGFAAPPETSDDKGWILLPGIDINGGDIVVPATGVTLAAGTSIPSGTTLNYDVSINGFALATGLTLQVAAPSRAAVTLPAGTVLSGDVRDATNNVLFTAGTMLTSSVTFAAGTQFAAGSKFNTTMLFGAVVWPKGVALPGEAGTSSTVVLAADKVLGVGALIPSGTNIKFLDGVESIALRPEVAGRQGKLWAIAPMLAEGSESWSMRLVAGADTEAADSRSVKPNLANGNLRLADHHYGLYGKALPPKGEWHWYDGADELGIPGVVAGEKMTDELLMELTGQTVAEFCGSGASECVLKTAIFWSEQGAAEWGDPSIKAGDVIDFDAIGYAELCTDLPEYCSYPVAGYEYVASSARYSVLRTGKGDLDLISGGSINMTSLFGVYTAGTSSTPTSANDPFNQARAVNAKGTVLNDPDGLHEKLVNGSTDSVYRAWYPDQGGNLLVQAGGNLTGSNVLIPATYVGRPIESDRGVVSSSVGNWLWRQGSADVVTGTQAQPTAWWINFGTYAGRDTLADSVLGFTGFGTLGGGNVDVNVAGDAGMLSPFSGSVNRGSANAYNQGLVLAVGSTGRISADGTMQLTGGGDLELRVGGALNPLTTAGTNNGTLTNLRGHIEVDATQVGSLKSIYGNRATDHVPTEKRAFDSFTSTRGEPTGAIVLVPGDATVSMSTMGDQLLQEVVDPGRINNNMYASFVSNAGVKGTGYSWFTLWTDHTAIDMFSAGGNVTPYIVQSTAMSDEAVMYPSILRAVSASGSLYYGKAVKDFRADDLNLLPIMLMPSANGQLDLLAANSIYAGGLSVMRSGADPDMMATPFNPAYAGWVAGNWPDLAVATNTSLFGTRHDRNKFPLFAFGSSTASDALGDNLAPSRFYAMTGDLVGVSSGSTVRYVTLNYRALPDERNGLISYEGAGPVRMIAGRDIVSSGNALGVSETLPQIFNSKSNLFVHNNDNDISVVSAGRDILYSTFNVAGPGTLEITAGRNILMEDKATVLSIGSVVEGDKRLGADIVMSAGVGKDGLNYAAFINQYINPANQAQSGIPLADQPGKVVKTYADELVTWLFERTGFTGTVEEALVAFNALPAEAQRIFARQVYYAEIKAGGREYTNPDSTRYGSYLRSRNAIGALIPTHDATGQVINYNGGITMFGAAGVNTLFGGDIQMIATGGQLVFGSEGAAPVAFDDNKIRMVTPGVMTQGQGNIQLYAKDSILLGQSRIMTTFGGDIIGWSDTGDINAGRGAKTTVVFTPPKRTYDQWGNVTLSPQVPSSGAGIATLNPIAEIAPGDIDLIAPLGTIDAGEAGIRVSGNVNVAAMHVANADNIKVQGDAAGIPMIAAVNIGALTSASAAAGSAAAGVQEALQRDRASARDNLPSVFTVRVLGFGNEPAMPAAASPGQGTQPVSYDTNSGVRVLGVGNLSPSARGQLTAREQSNLQ